MGLQKNANWNWQGWKVSGQKAEAVKAAMRILNEFPDGNSARKARELLNGEGIGETKGLPAAENTSAPWWAVGLFGGALIMVALWLYRRPEKPRM